MGIETGEPDSAGSGGAGEGQGAGPSEPSALERVLAGPSVEVEEAARDAVAAMSVQEKAGQVLVGQLGVAGTDPASIRKLHLGGVIVMDDAVPVAEDGTADVDALAQELTGVREALGQGRDWTGIIGVDQEGGLVSRVGEPLVEWPTPMSYGAAAAGQDGAVQEGAVQDDAGPDGAGPDGAGQGGGTEGDGGDSATADAGPSTAEADGAAADATRLARDGHALMARQLAELGFTMDFAPSVDVTIGARDPVIGARSFSSDPQAVSGLGAAATAGVLDAGVLPAPKHFPGHGSVTDDSHVTAPVQQASVAELEARDWLPFRELLADEARHTPMVMMGHIVLPALEPEVPSSVSAPAYEALRGLDPDGEYDGVVVTDALNMGALVERYGANEAPVRALAAGADLLLLPSDLTGAREAIAGAVESGEVPADRLDEAAERVVTMLLWRDRLQEGLASATPEQLAEVGAHGALNTQDAPAEQDADAAEVSRTVSAAALTVVDGVCGEALVGDSLQITGADALDRARLAAAARAAGLTVGSGPVVHLLGTAREAGRGDVVVVLDAPYGLGSSSTSEDGALIALYGRTPGAFEALVDVLTGKAPAPGALPVDAGQWPAGTGC